MPQRAIGFRDDGGEKIFIITNSAVLSKKMSVKRFKYGEKARRTQKELFDPYKDELPFLKNLLFTTMEHPYEGVDEE